MTADRESTTPGVLPFPQPGVLRNLEVGNFVFIADGTVQLEVTEATPHRVYCRVLSSGVVSSYKGVNLPGVPIDQPVFTEKDKADLLFGVEQQVDWVAVSFVRTAEDIHYARRYLNAAGSKALVMAKLERGEGIDNLDSILPKVDSVMVARGDLGVEIPMERVPRMQRLIVGKANAAGKLVVIATQMLRSMVMSPTPTRAEVSDVSNAVLEGTDAILLSDETAMGQYPVEALRMAVSTINEAESEDMYPYYNDLASHDRTQAITAAAAGLVRTLESKPIVLTSTGGRRWNWPAIARPTTFWPSLTTRRFCANCAWGGESSRPASSRYSATWRNWSTSAPVGFGPGGRLRGRRGDHRPRLPHRRVRHHQRCAGAEYPGVPGKRRLAPG